MTKQSQRAAAAGRPRRLALLCCTALLSLGLAACNTTGGTTTTTPTTPTSELGKARAAAKAAMDAAKTQSDAADTEAAKAEAAQMNIAMLQTGDPMAKTHAEAARAAARAAMTAYNTAKAESAKAAAATTDTAAVEARIAAQAAQRTAQAQAKIAMDKAAAAVKAAGMEVKVTYDDDGQATYRVGDVTIVPGAENSTVTTNGKTVITGKIDDVRTNSTTRRSYSFRAAVEAVDKASATAENPERKGQPQFNTRGILATSSGGSAEYQKLIPVIGSVTDSADDRARLTLVDKYMTTKSDKTVGIYFIPTNEIIIDGAVTEENPLGDVSGHKIMKAEGEFYQVLRIDRNNGTIGPTDNNVHQYYVPGNAGPKTNIYYYMDKDNNNKKKWLLRVEGGKLDAQGNVIEYQYRNILVHENVRSPDAKSFEHLNYGVWAGLKDDGNTLADLGTGFVSKLPDGSVTPVGDVPTFGKATYEGQWAGNVRAKAADGNGAITRRSDDMRTEVNFADNTLETTLEDLATFEGAIDGNGFKGTKISGVGTIGGLIGGDGYTGSFSGNLFGPKAEEIGGVFDITSEGAKKGEARGAFGGARVTE
ncbi:transferrin-binding protein-like solute binding protein [Hoeflea sp.]|uniref:transferrin-binding protein-like solute binding protein n=1 Tax=Hoeflea sp. TaxID=1940281 RepID=UPI003B02311D